MEANGGHSPLLQVKARPRGWRKDEVSIWIRETEKRRTVSLLLGWHRLLRRTPMYFYKLTYLSLKGRDGSINEKAGSGTSPAFTC